MSEARFADFDEDTAQTHRGPEPDREFLGREPLRIRGVLEHPESGTSYTLEPTDDPGRSLAWKHQPGQRFPVMAQVETPVYHPGERTGDRRASGPLERPDPPRLVDAGPMTKRRRERRLEEHRIRVQQLRRRLGDPNAALDQLVADRFDPDVLERMAEQLVEGLREGTTDFDDDDDATDDAR